MGGFFKTEKGSKEGLVDNRAMVAGALLALGIFAGLASSSLPVLVLALVVFGSLLFILIYRNLMLGIILFLVCNLIIPQAGPGFNLHIQTPLGERGIHFPLHEIFISMVLLAWLIQVFLKKADWRTKSPLTLPIIVMIGIYVLSCFIGVVHGGRILVIGFRFMRTMFFAYIFFLVINNIKTRKQLKQLLVITIVCATIVAGFGLVQLVMGQAWTENFSVKVLDRIGYPKGINYVAGGSEATEQAFRVNSTFAHPNVLGGYLIFFLPFYISLLWYYKRFSVRLLLFTGMIMNLTCLYFTGSRMNWIAAAVIALIYGVFGLFDRRLIVTFVVLVLIVVAVFLLINPPSFVSKRLFGSAAQKSTKARMYMNKFAIDLWLKRPFFGLGESMIGYVVVDGNKRQLWGGLENIYLTYLVSEGIVGLVAFMLVWFVFGGMMLTVRKKSREDPFEHYASEALFFSILGWAIANMFNSWFLFVPAMLTIWWFYLGWGASLYNVAKEGWSDSATQPSLRAA